MAVVIIIFLFCCIRQPVVRGSVNFDVMKFILDAMAFYWKNFLVCAISRFWSNVVDDVCNIKYEWQEAPKEEKSLSVLILGIAMSTADMSHISIKSDKLLYEYWIYIEGKRRIKTASWVVYLSSELLKLHFREITKYSSTRMGYGWINEKQRIAVFIKTTTICQIRSRPLRQYSQVIMFSNSMTKWFKPLRSFTDAPFNTYTTAYSDGVGEGFSSASSYIESFARECKVSVGTS